MDRKNKTVLLFIFLYLGFIAAGSLTPVPPIKIEIPHFDKVIHVFLYIPLGFLLSLPKLSSPFFIPLGFGSLYGALMEMLQYFVPGRICSWGDEIANVFGVGIGFGVGFLVRVFIQKRSSLGM